MAFCACGHDEKNHCPGDVRHANYKDEMRMNPKPRVTTCTNRHCQEPLCCCTNYREVEKTDARP